MVTELRQERRHDRRGVAGGTQGRHGGTGDGCGRRRGGHVDLEGFLWLGRGGRLLHLAGGRQLGFEVGEALATLQVVGRTQLLGAAPASYDQLVSLNLPKIATVRILVLLSFEISRLYDHQF